MKKILITTLVAGVLTVSAFGQGVVAISAGANKVEFTTDGITLTPTGTGTPIQVGTFGQLNVSAFSAAAGTVLTELGGLPDFTSAWSAATSTPLDAAGPQKGTLTANNITLSGNSGAPGATEEIEIVAWSGTATTWAAALTSAGVGGEELLGFTGSTLSGGALGYQVTTGNSSVPGTDVTGANGFNGLVLSPSVIPEPTTMALGGLGAAALLLFRRRK